MIYLDSSAVLKLVFREAESPALRTWLDARPHDTLVSSDLTLVEVARAVRRLDEGRLTTARALLDGMDLMPLSPSVLRDAQDVGPRVLRSLDALHLASAIRLGERLVAFLTYDDRLAEAAEVAELPVASPGRARP